MIQIKSCIKHNYIFVQKVDKKFVKISETDLYL